LKDKKFFTFLPQLINFLRAASLPPSGDGGKNVCLFTPLGPGATAFSPLQGMGRCKHGFAILSHTENKNSPQIPTNQRSLKDKITILMNTFLKWLVSLYLLEFLAN